jgi:hypothetical protein
MDTPFLDTVINDKRVNTWQADVSVNHKLVKFRLDTGADATVLPAETYSRLFQRPLSSADKLLCGPNRVQLDVIGRFDAQLQWRDRLTTQTVYVVRDIHQPLLGRDAIDALGMVKCLDAISSSLDPRQQYADLFTGLGCMDGEYTIRLKPDAQPFAVFTPRRVPVNRPRNRSSRSISGQIESIVGSLKSRSSRVDRRERSTRSIWRFNLSLSIKLLHKRIYVNLGRVNLYWTLAFTPTSTN